MQEFLLAFSVNHAYLVYLLIIVLAVIEGPILSVLCGILIKAGYFHFWPIYLVLAFGDILGDVVWYGIGRRFARGFIGRFGKYFNLTEERVSRAVAIFHKHKNPILIISKITNGFGFALVTLIAAGMARIPFGHYISLNSFGQLIWTGLLLGTGYFFGSLYIQIEAFFGRVSAFAFVVFSAVVVFYVYRYLRDRMLRHVNLDDK